MRTTVHLSLLLALGIAMPTQLDAQQRNTNSFTGEPNQGPWSLRAGAAKTEAKRNQGTQTGPKTNQRPARTSAKDGLGGGAPPNDNCATAIVLTPGALCTPTLATTAGATQSIPAISCGGLTGDADDDVWFSFVATATSHTVFVQGDELFDAVVDVRSGACNGTNITCADETGDGEIEIVNLTALMIGATYYIRVYDFFDSTPTPEFVICVTLPSAPPANDNCPGAIELISGSSCVLVPGTTLGATQSIPAINCNGSTGNAGDDVWYRFTATATSHTVVVIGEEDFDAVIDVRSGACNGTNIACADDTFEGEGELVSLNGLTIGQVYYIRVYDWYGPASFTPGFSICVFNTPAAPANDLCSAVTPSALAAGATLTFTGTTEGATADGDALPGSELEGFPIVWHAFTLSECATVTVDYCTTDPAFDLVLIVLTDCPAGEYVMGDFDTETCGDNNVTTTFFNLGPGTYYIPVGQISFATTGPYTIHVAASDCIPPPANDECANAIPLLIHLISECPATSTTGTNALTEVSVDDPPCDESEDGYLDVWYSFNSLGNTEVFIDIDVITATDLFAEVLDVCGGNSIFCDLAAVPPYSVPVTPNTDYLVRMITNLQFGEGGEFTICISADLSTGMVEIPAAPALTVYPNPTTGAVSITSSINALNSLVELMDVTGRQVMARRISFNAGQVATLELPASLAAGSYVLRATHAGGTLEQRLLVE